MNQHAFENYIRFFETLTPESLDQLDHLFIANARFKDPFNDVVGTGEIRKIFQHMFTSTQDSRFVVDDFASTDNILYLHWHYYFKTKQGKQWEIPGMSRVFFDDAGKVTEHVDYWDPAESIYEKLPVLGGLMRVLKRKLSATT
jgi:steroid delta-isomerase